MSDITEIASVVGVAPDLIQIEVHAGERYAAIDPRLEIGSYLKISDDDGKTVIVIVQSYRIKDAPAGPPEQEVGTPRFLLDTQPGGAPGERPLQTWGQADHDSSHACRDRIQ